MQHSDMLIRFLENLRIPEGPKAGEKMRLGSFQTEFLRNTFDGGNMVGVLSVARGNGKSALVAGVALAELMGRAGSDEPRREILAGARTREQAKVIYTYMQGLARSLPAEEQARFRWRRAPMVEVEYRESHIVRCIAADGKNVLGTSPTLVVMDERGHWPDEKGDELEAVLLSGLGKRRGRALIISTSAASDSHSFSQWVDNPPRGCYVQEHRPQPGRPPDDEESLRQANPGADDGIGASVEWLVVQAQRAQSRGGSALSSFRLYNRNERVVAQAGSSLITVDEWLNAETTTLPGRAGAAVVGIDLGGSASMSAASFYWPETGRLEAFGAFPSRPELSKRGLNDGVRDRYVEMMERGELKVLGGAVVPTDDFLRAVMDWIEGFPIMCLVSDRYRQAEFWEAMRSVGLKVPVIYRGMGYRDGGEDCERFRRALFDGRISVTPSLLLRSAFSDALTLRDPAGNLKLAKARSLGRIDAAASTVLAVAEGRRRVAVKPKTGRSIQWA